MSELVPYEVPPVDPEDELTVQVAGGGAEPERLLRITRPRDGLVRVREWTSEAWGEPALERELAADALLRALEEAARQRRQLSQELYRIRRWLTDGA
jgi:hypothetical protein